MQVVLHSDDINLELYWAKTLENRCKLVDTFEELYLIKSSLIIINNTAFDESPKGSIKKLKALGNSVLVLHRTPNIETAKELLLYGASGYGNALMKAHFILSAIDTIQEGMVWLHPEFTSQLICQIPAKQEKNIDTLISVLSSREKDVVLLLKEGDTYKVVAEKLDITPRTVKAHASSIYTKLYVKDRLALALLLK